MPAIYKITGFLFLISACASPLFSQWGPGYEAVKIIVSPDHHDWTYRLGEEATFTISVWHYHSPVQEGTVFYEIGPEQMEPTIKEAGKVIDGSLKVNGGTLKVPGFLRCVVTYELDGKTYRGTATAAFEPLKIVPTTGQPADFIEFWEKAKKEASGIPMAAKMEFLEELSDEKIDVYQVSLQNYRYGSRIYGVLNVPKKEVKMPAILKVPGAGVWPAFMAQDEDAKKGAITFEIRIHGVPMVSEESRIYADLWNSGLHEYWNYNLDDRDRYYYKRVYMGCVRAIDFIESLPQYDGKNLAVSGGSQGGALSIVTAALDERVKWLVAYYPALCDHTGYLHGRAGGWPHLFKEDHYDLNAKPDKIETSKYYDVVNFARQLKVPGYYAWGFNDEVCPPTSMYAAYNVITAPKELILAPNAGHHHFPEQQNVTTEWLFSRLFSE